MTNTLRNLSIGLATALLAACGGGSGTNAALSHNFNYGAPMAPTTSEQTAASSAQTSLSTTASFNSSANANTGASVIGFAASLDSLVFGSTGLSMAPVGTDLRGALIAADFSTCSTVVGGTVTFSNCTQTSGSYTLTLNGTISSAAAGMVTWNVTATFSGTVTGGSINFTLHESGNLDVTSTKVTGNALADISASGSVNGQSFSIGVSSAVIIDVTYQTTPTSCVTSGTVEVKRVWTQKPSGLNVADAGVKITWTGCNMYTVAHSQ